ncbi:putative ribonuclease H-like domain-containing protein [Tanacetum coccineum]
MDNVRTRGSYSPIKRSYYTKPAFRPKDLKQDVKTFGVQNMTTVGTRAVVNTCKGKMDTDLKKSRWVWTPKVNYLDHVSKDSGSFMLKKVQYVDPKVVDNGCSSHMTGNKAYLLDYEDYNEGFVAFGSDPKGGQITGKGKIRTANLDFDDVYFVDELKFNLFFVSQMCDKKNSVLFTKTGCLILSPSFKLLDESQVVLRAPRKDDVYSLDLKNIIPSGGITCLYANATADESKLWHRRLGHVNFKNINKLVKGHLVRGLPSKVFVNDHTCVACKKGKQQASGKASEKESSEASRITHMDFYWTCPLLRNLQFGIIMLKALSSDNGTEFKNHAMNQFCAKKEIKREFKNQDKDSSRRCALVVNEKPSKSSPKDNDVQDSEDVADKEGQHQMAKDEQVLHDELKKMIAQEVVAKALDDGTRQAFKEEKRNIASQKRAAQTTSINKLSTGSNAFLSKKNPRIHQTLQSASWVEAMQRTIAAVRNYKGLILVDLPSGKKAIGTEEGIDYDEVLAPVARIEAIKSFLSFASYMGFTVYQIDVKSAFLYGNNGGAMHQQIIIHHSSCGSDVLGGRWSNDIECRTSKL